MLEPGIYNFFAISFYNLYQVSKNFFRNPGVVVANYDLTGTCDPQLGSICARFSFGNMNMDRFQWIVLI